MSAQDIISLLGVVVAAIVAAVGLRQYGDSVRLRRAEWLYKLYDEFYVQENLKEIREKLDSKQGMKEIESLVSKPEGDLTNAESRALAKFTDYLNFFEFMIYLKKKGAIKRDDIMDMFSYYLKCIANSEAILDYLPREGYEMLSGFTAQMKSGRTE